MSVYSPGTYSYIRGAAVEIGRVTSLAYHPNGRRIWMAALVGSSDQVGFPVHLFASDGRWLRSTGPSQPLLRRDGYIAFARHLAAGSAGETWAVTRYGTIEIERYNAEGRLTGRFTYRPAWSPSLERLMPQRAGEPPLPERPPFFIDSDTRLWIATLVPEANWRRGIVSDATGMHGGGVVGDVSKLFDSILEVIDLERPAVIARIRFDEVVVSLLSGGFVVLYREDARGDPRLWIERWSVRE